ncbi:MAG: hypothetical protein QM730_28570 [Anaerolineales bacterium]
MFFLFRFVIPISSIVPTPTPNPNTAVGRMRYADVNDVMDKVSISAALPLPAAGMHYEGWLVDDDNTKYKDIGALTFDASQTGHSSLHLPTRKTC